MKKTLSILLVAAMLVTMISAMAITSNADAITMGVNQWNPSAMDAGYSAIFTPGNTNPGGDYSQQVSFKLVEGNTYEVVEIALSVDATFKQLAIPENGFVWGCMWDAADSTVDKAMQFQNTMTEGGKYVITDLDLSAKSGSGAIEAAAGTSTEPAATTATIDNNVATGLSYETSKLYRAGGQDVNYAYVESADINYPDTDNKEITDGVIAIDNVYSNEAWTGLHGLTPDAEEAGYAWVKLDLTKAYDLTKIAVYTPDADFDQPAGVVGPEAANVTFWADGVQIEGTTNIEAYNDNVQIVSIDATGVKATEVEIRIVHGGWIFIGEVAVEGTEASADGEQNPGEGEQNPGEGEQNPGEGETPAPEVDVTPEVDVMGEENADAVYNAVITAPESYVAGEEVTVTVTIKDITVETGLHAVKINLYYDNDKLELTGLTEGSSSVPAFEDYAEWEDMSRYVEVDGITMIEVAAATAGDKDGNFTVAKNDGDLVFNIKFVAKADAKGDIAVYAPHATVTGSYVGETAAVDYVGNGSEIVIKEGVEASDDQEPTKDEDPTPSKPGDATSMIVFAIIALVAIAGSAVVIKARK